MLIRSVRTGFFNNNLIRQITRQKYRINPIAKVSSEPNPRNNQSNATMKKLATGKNVRSVVPNNKMLIVVENTVDDIKKAILNLIILYRFIHSLHYLE